MCYLKVISICSSDLFRYYLAVTLICKTLKAHKTAASIHSMIIGLPEGILLVSEILLHFVKENRVIAGQFELVSDILWSPQLREMNIANLFTREPSSKLGLGESRFS